MSKYIAGIVCKHTHLLSYSLKMRWSQHKSKHDEIDA